MRKGKGCGVRQAERRVELDDHGPTFKAMGTAEGAQAPQKAASNAWGL